MGDGDCRVMFRGGTIQGFVKEEVFVTFASMMKRPLYYVEPYFSGNTVCLKSRLSRERAGLVRDSLRRMGMDVWVECDSDPEEDDASVDSPSEQPEAGTEPETMASDAQGKPLEPFGESLVKALLGPGGSVSKPAPAKESDGRPPFGGDGARVSQPASPRKRHALPAMAPGPLPAEVERVTLPQSERCPFKAFLLIALFAMIGGGLGTGFAYLLIFRLHTDITVLTVLFIWTGTLLGVRLGDRLGGHCGKPHVVMLAVSPVGLIMFGVSFIQVFTYLLDENRSVIWGVVESICLFATPLLAVLVVRGQAWCPVCRRPYRSRTQFVHEDASPEKVLESLKKGKVPRDEELVHADGESPRAKGQIEVSVESVYCPDCKRAVVDGVLTHKDGKGRERELVFFSSRWDGGSPSEPGQDGKGGARDVT